MTQRLNLAGKPNEGVEALRRVEAWLGKSLDPKLLALVKTRASQINGCAYCVDMHSMQARPRSPKPMLPTTSMRRFVAISRRRNSRRCRSPSP